MHHISKACTGSDGFPTQRGDPRGSQTSKNTASLSPCMRISKVLWISPPRELPTKVGAIEAVVAQSFPEEVSARANCRATSLRHVAP